MQQIILPIITDDSSYNASDFVVSYSNLEAYRAVTSNIIWPQNRLLIIGESGSGKTHLTKIWQQKSGAHYIKDSSQLVSLKEGSAFIFEDLQNYPEIEILNIINTAFEHKKKLLLTSSYYNHIELKDLRSRFNSTYKVLIKDPDENMVQVLLSKMLHDKQIKLNKEILNYIAVRVKRSFVDIKIFVIHLDKLSLSQKRNITTRLIKEVLEELKLANEKIND
ncbi:MAG: DnaA/Hda family protein [Candidatus Midichloria sp.]|nr:DnaA/Hda family protein [Candidatus Midichloria sp.]